MTIHSLTGRARWMRPDSVLATTLLRELGGGTAIVDGTSFSAPHVAAAAAVIKSANPGWTNADVREALQETAVYLGASTYYGHGLLDIAAAVAYSPPTTLTVDIDGPTLIEPGATCTWWAVHDGTGPFTYAWYNDGGSGGTGSDSSFTTSKESGNLMDHFSIDLYVEDSLGASGHKQITVYEDSGAPPCFI